MSNTVIENAPFRSGALDKYPGKWVAIRGGEVVAAADSLEKLRQNPEVRRSDAVYVVPESSSYFY